MRLLRSLVVLVLLGAAAVAQGQSPSASAATPSATTLKTPEAKPEDVKSPEAIVAALYDVISGPAGTRDWDRFRSLFTPEGRLIPNGVRPDGTWAHRVLTVEDFAQHAGENVKKEGFFERGVFNKIEQYGTIAHVFGTYESRHEKDGPVFARGINSFSLASDGKRWYVVQILWQQETPTTPIPEQYLKK
jgi:hypothetical protein